MIDHGDDHPLLLEHRLQRLLRIPGILEVAGTECQHANKRNRKEAREESARTGPASPLARLPNPSDVLLHDRGADPPAAVAGQQWQPAGGEQVPAVAVASSRQAPYRAGTRARERLPIRLDPG